MISFALQPHNADEKKEGMLPIYATLKVAGRAEMHQRPVPLKVKTFCAPLICFRYGGVDAACRHRGWDTPGGAEEPSVNRIEAVPLAISRPHVVGQHFAGQAFWLQTGPYQHEADGRHPRRCQSTFREQPPLSSRGSPPLPQRRVDGSDT